MKQLVVDGHYLDAFTSWGDLDYSLCWPGYSDELTFDVASYPRNLRIGAIAMLIWGGERIWAGPLEEPVRGERLRAKGLHRMAEDYTALDPSSNVTTVPYTAVDAAIAGSGGRAALPWTRGIPFGVFDTAPLKTDAPSTLKQVIDANAALFPGEDWGVTPARSLVRMARPTPRLHVRPGGDGIGIARDNYASTLIARYKDSGTSAFTTVIRTDAAAATRWGYKETTISKPLNDGASMTLAQAQAMLDSMLKDGRARPGWTQALELEYGAIVNNHQQPIDLASIKPWEVVRVHGLNEDVADLAGQSYVDMPIARIDLPKKSPVTLTPVGLVNPMGDVLSGKEAA